MDEGFLVSGQFVKQVESIYRRLMAQHWNPTAQRGRWQQSQPSQIVVSDSIRVYTLAIRGNASAGTISWEVELGAGYDSGTWNFDDDQNDVKSSLIAFDASVATTGGDLRWNVVKIKFSSPLVALRVTATSLTRETNGIEPKVELSACYEPSGWWEAP